MPPHEIVQRSTYGRLAVEVHPRLAAASRAAAAAGATYLHDVIAARGAARVVFAGDPTQRAFLAALARPRTRRDAIDWSRLTAFHLDAFVGLAADAPASRRGFLRRHLLARVRPGAWHELEAGHPDLAAACARYAAALSSRPLDLVCLGIGENGRLAFNDPAVADFDDPAPVKPVELDAACRQQQVNPGAFASLAEVPRYALTLTLSLIRRAQRLTILASGSRCAAAVRATLHDAITSSCPATLLRLHPHATLYLDAAAAALAVPVSRTSGRP